MKKTANKIQCQTMFSRNFFSINSIRAAVLNLLVEIT